MSLQLPAVITAPIETFQDTIGLSEVDPPLRGFSTGAAVSAAIYTIKPVMYFRTDGTAKPWSMMSDESDAVAVPWWGPGALFGALNLLV